MTNPTHPEVEAIVKRSQEEWALFIGPKSGQRTQNLILRKILEKVLNEWHAKHEAMVADILKMADELEHECGKDGDKGTKQWMAFKGFRNGIRDKYGITPPTSAKTEGV